VVSEITDGRHAGAQVLLLCRRDHRPELVARQLRDLLQRPRAAVAAQMHVGVDESGQQRRVVGDRAPVGRRKGRRLDADDHPVVDEDERAAWHRPLAVEGDCGPVSAHGASLSRRP
jgi:hypothetical protein